jgi:hypothetical protein
MFSAPPTCGFVTLLGTAQSRYSWATTWTDFRSEPRFYVRAASSQADLYAKQEG